MRWTRGMSEMEKVGEVKGMEAEEAEKVDGMEKEPVLTSMCLRMSGRIQ